MLPQSSAYNVVSIFRVNGDPEDGDASGDDSKDAAALHVLRIINSIWTNVAVSKHDRQVNPATNPDYSIFSESRAEICVVLLATFEMQMLARCSLYATNASASS